MDRFGIAALATLLAIAGLAACGSEDDNNASPSGAAPSAVPIGTIDPTPEASPSGSATAVPAGKSRIDIALNDCEGCVVTAYIPLVKTSDDLKTWKSEPVTDGKTSLVVPTKSTHSMSFDVQGTKDNALTFENARPAVVLAYRTPAGGKQEGNWCWAGTEDSVVTLTIRHQSLPASQFDGALPTEDHEDIFEAKPALPVVDGEWQPSPDGGLGHQDAPYCSPS